MPTSQLSKESRGTCVDLRPSADSVIRMLLLRELVEFYSDCVGQTDILRELEPDFGPTRGGVSNSGEIF